MLYNFDLLSNKKLPDKTEVKDEGRHHLLEPLLEGKEQNVPPAQRTFRAFLGHPLQQRSAFDLLLPTSVSYPLNLLYLPTEHCP